MKNRIVFVSIFGMLLQNLFCKAQDSVALTLREAIEIAQKSAPDVLAGRHSFRSNYWNYCHYKANYLPALVFSSTPNFNHSINPITLPDGSSQFTEQNQLITDGNLTLSQNIAWTGGTVFLKSGLQRLDIFENKQVSYQATPIIAGYQQAILGYNYLKWDKKIEPLKFEEAKRSYVELLEWVAVRTSNKFFKLALAQTNLHIARFNYANADTLYTFARGRYNIGTITENEILQLEINRLTEENNRLNAQIEVDDCMQDLCIYLGMKNQIKIQVVVEEIHPSLTVDLNEVLGLAIQGSPDIIAQKRRLLESESNLAQAQASRGFKFDLYAQFGLTQTATDLNTSYKNPIQQQYVELGIRIPILDWGRGTGQVKVAQSNRDMVSTQVQQDRTFFEQNVMKLVKQFNLQAGKVNIAIKTDQTAEKRAEVAKRLYILGKSTILDLNTSILEKDTAKRNYILSISNYWALFYGLRSMTLYDFEKQMPLTEDYTLLLK